MAIPANELRIGNLVDYNDRYDRRGIVTWIQKASVEITYLERREDLVNGVIASPEYIIPIPLTPEVLERCGFDWIIWDGNEHHKVLSYKNTPIHIYWDGSEWCFKYGFDSDLTFAACQYVHQLQNLIHVLTGEELPVTL